MMEVRMDSSVVKILTEDIPTHSLTDSLHPTDNSIRVTVAVPEGLVQMLLEETEIGSLHLEGMFHEVAGGGLSKSHIDPEELLRVIDS